MKDARSKTSRANLGENIPEALHPKGSVVIPVRFPAPTAARLRATADYVGVTVSALVREAVEEFLAAHA